MSYVGVRDQARVYVEGARNYEPETVRWMIAGLLETHAYVPVSETLSWCRVCGKQETDEVHG